MRPTVKEQPESIILHAVRDALQMDGYLVIRHQQSFGSYKGFPDLTAIKEGKTIYIEVKTPIGKQSKWQVQFQKDLEEHGGIYVLARDVDDIKPYLTRVQSLF